MFQTGEGHEIDTLDDRDGGAFVGWIERLGLGVACCGILLSGKGTKP